MKPEIAVCIVTWNSEAEIGPCLDAVRAQSVATEFHVWDNASRDGTAAVIHRFDGLTLHQSELNLGFCAANNRLIDQTTAPFVLFLNPDTSLAPSCLERLLATLREAPAEVAAIGPKMVKPGGGVIDSAGIEPGRDTLSPHDRGEGEVDRGQYDTPGEYFGPSFACALWRREAIEALKLDGEFLDEDFFAYFEDVDICWRARRLGRRFLYEPHAVCEHRRGGPSAHGPTLAARAFVNRYLLLIANENLRNGWLFLLRLIPYEALRLVWKTFETPGFGVAWPMLRQSWRHAWKKRRLLNTHATNI